MFLSCLVTDDTRRSFWWNFRWISSMEGRILSFSSGIDLGLLTYTFPFKKPQRRKFSGLKSHDLAGQSAIAVAWDNSPFKFRIRQFPYFVRCVAGWVILLTQHFFEIHPNKSTKNFDSSLLEDDRNHFLYWLKYIWKTWNLRKGVEQQYIFKITSTIITIIYITKKNHDHFSLRITYTARIGPAFFQNHNINVVLWSTWSPNLNSNKV